MILNLSSKQQTFAMIAASDNTPPERFQTGIGYQLLHLAYPKHLPSVLLWA